MKLIRNAAGPLQNKYALMDARKLAALQAGQPEGIDSNQRNAILNAIAVLDSAGLINWGAVGSPNEFVALMLKDIFTPDALYAYSWAVGVTDPEYANEMRDMAERSGKNHPNCKRPD